MNLGLSMHLHPLVILHHCCSLEARSLAKNKLFQIKVSINTLIVRQIFFVFSKIQLQLCTEWEWGITVIPLTFQLNHHYKPDPGHFVVVMQL